jgi:cell division protein FtsI (penicillin-binding protein 3)
MSRSKAVPVNFEWRLYTLLGILLVLFASVAGRILFLQVLSVEGGRDFLQSQGEMRAVRTAEIPAYRGLITDRRGEPLAVSTPVISLAADPRRLAGVDDLRPLAAALGQDSAELEARLEDYRGRHFMYLARHLQPQAAREVLALRVPGVFA